MIEMTGSGAGADNSGLGHDAQPTHGVFSSGLDSIFGPGFQSAALQDASAPKEAAPARQEVVPTATETQPAPETKPASALEVDSSQSKVVGKDGKPLAQRKLEDVKNIKISAGHKEGDPEPNFVIDKDGKIIQKRPLDRASGENAGGGGDDTVFVEVDDSAGDQARSASAAQKASLRSLISAIESQCASANRSPDIPPQLLAALDAPANIPAPRIVRRGGGGGGTAGWGGGGGSMGGNGSFFKPGTPPASFGTDNAILPTAGGSGASGGGGGVAPMPAAGGDRGGDTPAPSVDFSKMGGIDMSNPVDKVVAMVSANEGKPNSINWNDNGHGISVGLFQANQKAGELPMLLTKMNESNPQLFKQVFGNQADNMLNERYVRSANFSQGNDLGKMMQEAVNRPEFQKVQLDMMREKVAHASQVAGNYGIKSELGVALTADMINQLGEGGAKKHLAAAGGKGHEEDKIRAVVASSESNQFRNGRFERIASSGTVGMDQFRLA